MMCAFMQADEGQSHPQHYRVYAGADVFFNHIHFYTSSSHATTELKSTTVFGGLRIGYDYLEPQSFYFGTEGLIAKGGSSTKIEELHKSYFFSSKGQGSIHTSPLFAHLEQRFGYTLQSQIAPSLTLTPFGGLGWYYTQTYFHEDSDSANWFYGAVGLRVAEQFSQSFALGFNVKAMYSFAGKESAPMWSFLVEEQVKNVWGYEIALPLTWNIGSIWDLQFQPYLLQIDFNGMIQILGLRIEAGYSF